MDSGEYQQNLDSFNAAKDQLSSIVDQVKGLTQGKQDAVDKLGTVLQSGGDIGGSIMGVLGTIEQVTRGTALEGSITSLKNQISTLKDNLADGIQKGVDSGITKATEAAKSLTGGNQQLNSMIDGAASSTRATTTQAINQAAGGDLGGLMETAKGATSSMVTTGSDAVKLVRNTVSDAASTVEQGVSKAVSAGTETMTGLGNQAAAMASTGAARASSTVTGAAKSATSMARRAARQVKQQIQETQQEVTQPVESAVGKTTPLGVEYGDEGIAAIKRLQAINMPETLGAGELDTIKRLEPELFNQPAGTQQAAGASKISATNTEPASSQPQSLPDSAPAETPSLMPELPDFEGLSDLPVSNIFGLVPKATQAVASIAPKLTTVESTLGELAGGAGRAVSEATSGLTSITRAFAGNAPSKVLGIVNKGMRGDSTLARALKLKLPGEEATAQASAPKVPEIMPEFNPEAIQEKAAQLISKPTTSFTQQLPEITMENALETKISPYIPDFYSGKNPVLSDYYASGVPKDILQAEKLTPNVSSGQFTAPQARITAPEPTGQPTIQTPSEISGTPNNPSAQAVPQVKPAGSGSVTPEPTQVSSQAPKPTVSEIEPAPAVPAAPAPTPTAPAIASTEASVGGDITKAATGELEAGADAGPEGLVVGAVLAGLTSLIGGFIKQFHQSTPTVPTFANTGASFTPEQAVAGGASF